MCFSQYYGPRTIEKITAASDTPIELIPASNNLYAYGQENPIKLQLKFTAII